MRSYAAEHIFSEREQRLLIAAQDLVRRCPSKDHDERGELIRCHELARAVGAKLGLKVADGRFGFVEHSWLWLGPWPTIAEHPLFDLPRVLDVYVPGQEPQVALVDTASGLPARYYPAVPARDDIRDGVVEELLEYMGAVVWDEQKLCLVRNRNGK